MKKVCFALIVLFVFSTSGNGLTKGMPTVLVRQPETVISLIYKDIPGKISIQPQELTLGQPIDCQTWVIQSRNIRTKNLLIKVSGAIRWGISRGKDCPVQAMVYGYSDGRIQFCSDSYQNFQGEILIVSSLGSITVEVLEPSGTDIKAIFSSFGKIVPLVSSTSQERFVCEVTSFPAVPLVSLYTSGDWALYEAWEIPEMGWTRIQVYLWENPFKLAPSKDFFKEIGRINILPVVKNATSWGAIKSEVWK